MTKHITGKLIITTSFPTQEETKTELFVDPKDYEEFVMSMLYALESTGLEMWSSKNSPLGAIYMYRMSVLFGPSYRTAYVNVISEV